MKLQKLKSIWNSLLLGTMTIVIIFFSGCTKELTSSGFYKVKYVKQAWPKVISRDHTIDFWKKYNLVLEESDLSIHFNLTHPDKPSEEFELPKNKINYYVYRFIDQDLNNNFVTLELSFNLKKEQINTTFNIDQGNEDLIKVIKFKEIVQ